MNTHLQEAIEAGTYERFISRRMPFRLCRWDAKAPDGKGNVIDLGKTPLHSGWKTRALKHRDLLTHAVRDGNNVGLRLPKYLMVVDVDPRNGGDKSFDWLCINLGLDPSDWTGQTTGSGGHHYFLRKPVDVPIRKTLKAYPGIEFLSYGFYVVGPGSLHPKTGKPYVWWEDKTLHEAPESLLDALQIAEDAQADAAPTEPGRIDAEWLEAILEALDPAECVPTNAQWEAFAMDCHYLTNGCPFARDVFLAWCRLDNVYNTDEIEEKNRRRWDSFTTKPDGKGRVRQGGTLFKALWRAGRADLIPPDSDAQADFDGELPDIIGPRADTVRTTVNGLEYTIIGDVERRRVDWAWQGRIAAGKLNIVAGEPETGKTMLTCYIAAQITRDDGQWIDGGSPDPGAVIFLSAEDDLADGLGPRLEAAGADLNLCAHIPATVKVKGGRRMLNLADDLAKISEVVDALETTENPVRLIIIDPITSYMGRSETVDTYRASDVRGVLTPLVEWAAASGIAVLCVMHLNKKGGDSLLSRVQDSQAYTALARSVLFTVPEPCKDKGKTGRIIFGKGKLNIAKDPGNLIYHFEEVELTDSQGPYPTARAVFDGRTDQTIEGAFNATRLNAKRKRETPEQDFAQSFLLDVLRSGPVKSKDVIAHAELEGISETTLGRARRALKIETKREGFGKGSVVMWRLPDSLSGDSPPHGGDGVPGAEPPF